MSLVMQKKLCKIFVRVALKKTFMTVRHKIATETKIYFLAMCAIWHDKLTLYKKTPQAYCKL